MPKRGTNIYKRKDGRWEARYVQSVNADGTKKYASVYAKSYREARDKQIVCQQNVNSVVSGSSNIPLAELMRIWLNSSANTIRRSTYLKYESMITNHLETGIGTIPIKYITSCTIDRFSDEKLHGANALSPKTVNDLLVILNLAFSYAAQEYGIRKPVFRRVKEEHKEMRVLSVAEQTRLEQFLSNDMDLYKLGVLLTLYTGLRIGELCALQWDDVCNGNVTVNKSLHRIKMGNRTVVEVTAPKTDTSNRTIPLPTFLITILEQYRATGSVLKTGKGKQVEPRLMQAKFSRYVTACGLEKTNFHALRHTFATRCVEAGFDVKTLSEILGHTDVKTTLNRYVHSSFEQKRRNMEKLKSTVLM